MCFTLLGFSCNDDEDIWEIPLNSNNPVIENITNEVKFKFYLLNEQGKPATSFKQGENFNFCLEMENQEKASNLRIVDDIYKLINDGFCKVISQTKGVIGNPFMSVNCTDNFRTFPFYGEDKQCKIIIPWIDKNQFFSSVPFCFDVAPQPVLAKGVYYTEFSHVFSFYIPPDSPDKLSSSKKIGPLTFKINFEIN